MQSITFSLTKKFRTDLDFLFRIKSDIMRKREMGECEDLTRIMKFAENCWCFKIYADNDNFGAVVLRRYTTHAWSKICLGDMGLNKPSRLSEQDFRQYTSNEI